MTSLSNSNKLHGTSMHILFIFSFIILFISPLITGCFVKNEYSTNDDSSVTIVDNRNSFIELDFSIYNYDIKEVEEDGVIYSDVDFDSNVVLNDKGFAALPFLNASIQLPLSGAIEYQVIDQEYVDIPLDYAFLPAKGVIYRNQNPADVKRSIAPESMTGEFYPYDIIKVSEPYIFRDVRGVNIYAHSFRYNAETKILRIYTKLRVSFNIDTSIPARNSMIAYPGSIVKEMEPIYKSIFINYGLMNSDSDIRLSFANDIEDFGEMLVIYTSRDASAISPYIDWKRQMGYKVHTKQVSTGTNVKSTIQTEYNNNNNLLYVQLVGDWADIKSDLGTSQNQPMDPMLGCVNGSDLYPDLIVGRFSAENTTHVTTQVNKAINYEKNPDSSGTWYKKNIGLGSAEGPGDDSEIDFNHIQNISDYRLKATTYSNSYLFTDGDSASGVSSYLNSGVSVLNYTGHGYISGWGTTSFSSTNVNNSSNGSKLPIIFSVACQVGQFNNSTTSFAETWLRKSGGGAVAALMSTINQPWTPPMRGQDYMNDLLTGGYDYASNPGSGISTTEGRTTFGSISFNGLVLMYTEKSNTEDKETLQSWTIFGDAALQVRTDTPKQISISNNRIEPGLAFSTRVTSGSSGVKSARVTISQGSNAFTAITNSNGDVSINHNFTSGSVTLVVSGFNLDTIFQTVNIISTPTNQAPNAQFSYSTNELQVQFTDTSSDPDNNIASRSWTFGDGQTSTATNPNHTYSTAGTYTVKLTVTDTGGLSDSYTKSITVSEQQGSSYSLIVSLGTGSGTYSAGAKITIQAGAPPEGSAFARWEIVSGNPTIADLESSTTTLTMPSSNVEIMAVYNGNNEAGCGLLYW